MALTQAGILSVPGINQPGGVIPDGTSINSTGNGTVSIASGGVVNSMVSASAGIFASKLLFTPAGATATNRNVNDKLRDVVSVKDYGAIGNGSADDTVAVQNAINYVTSIGGGTVVFPNGVYCCSTLIVNSFVTLFGLGGTIKTFGSPDRQIRLAGGSQNISILNIKFDSPGLNQGAQPEAGVIKDNGGAVNFRLQNCSFYNIPTNLGQRMTALQMDAVSSIVAYNYVDQCGGDCLNFNSEGYNVVMGNVIASGGDGGVAFNNGARGAIVGNCIRKCSLGVGAGPTGTTANTFTSFVVANNEFDACDFGVQMGWYAFAGREGPINVKIVGNTMTRCKTAGIGYFGNSTTTTINKYIEISGNVIANMGTADYDGTTDPNANGILLDYASASNVTGNTIHDVTGNGIKCVQSSSSVINGNTLVNVGGGVVLASGTSYIVSNNRIATSTATAISGGTGSSITSNNISNVTGAGISIANSSTRFVVSLNNINVASGGGVVIGTGTSNSVNVNNLFTP